MKDEERFKECVMEHNGVYVDFSRQRVTKKTLDLLIELAERAGLEQKIKSMFSGEHINATEDRAVLHAALRVRRPCLPACI
jgi:glucose-6-phosphate isomerase